MAVILIGQEMPLVAEGAPAEVPVDAQDVDGDEALDSDAGDADVELPELPAQADETRGVFSSIAAAFTTALDTIKGLFGF